MNQINVCCAECGEEGGARLKVCKSCMQVKYCNAICQKKHWPTHKKQCKLRVAELRDEALFKDPPVKEDCPICFLPMPILLISCVTLSPATISSVPINDFAEANEELANEAMERYYPCCGKNICGGCIYSFAQSGNDDKCPFCNTSRAGKPNEEQVEEVMKRVEANDAASIYLLGNHYHHGLRGFQQDHAKAIELYTRAADLGNSEAHFSLGGIYRAGGNLKKAKFHYEAAAMAGNEMARSNLGGLEANSGNMERAIKHWKIAASAGYYIAMHELRTSFDQGVVCRESIDSTLEAYNNSCAEVRSAARDAYIRVVMGNE
jgi:TPR repeat protein